MATVAYRVGDIELKWEVALLMTRVSSLSKELVRAAVAADSAGVPYNPTAATVEFAFLTSSANPAGGDWHAGAWDTTLIGTYVAGVLVGPGAVVLPTGTYYGWIRITDASAGEVVVRQFDTLIVE
jgi:hypothetical protein